MSKSIRWSNRVTEVRGRMNRARNLNISRGMGLSKLLFSKIITYTEKQNLPEDWGSLEAYIAHLSEIMAKSMNVSTEFSHQKMPVTTSEEQQVALEFGSLAHQNERHWWMNLR